MAERGDSHASLRTPAPVGPEQLRLMSKIARLYYERGMRQVEIARELHISQPRVSRLLKKAQDVDMVRTIVTQPAGVYTDVEERLQERYGLRGVTVVDGSSSEGVLTAHLGQAAAGYLDATLIGGDTVGISSWSASLLSMVGAMSASTGSVVDRVVQLVGGIGEPSVQIKATQLIDGFARLTGATPLFVHAPGVLGSATAMETMLGDPSFREVTGTWAELTLALVGIGSLEPSPLLRQSGNAIHDADREALQAAGAVGDICLRFFDENGDLIRSEFNSRVVGIVPELLRSVDRRVGVAGGRRKYAAIRAAVTAGWVNILITDLDTAERLLEEPAV